MQMMFSVQTLESTELGQVSEINNLEVVECFEQNIRKQIECKRRSSTNQVNRVQNIWAEIWK